MIYTQGSSENEKTSHLESPVQDNIWKNAPIRMRETLQHTFILDSWSIVKHVLISSTCITITDGSFDPTSKYAMACWIIEGKTLSRQCKWTVHTPGKASDMEVYWAKLFRIYCILLCI